jgi:prephenate dehydrogenase
MNAREPPLFSRAAIIGLGLMGGSLGMAMRASGTAATVSGYDPEDSATAAAVAAGAVDEAAASVTACVTNADLVVLATPVLAMRQLLAEMAPMLDPGGLVTDLGSTKAQVMAWARAELPGGARFVGGHPMCGSERSGIGAASAALFRGAVWCITPDEGADAAAIAQLSELIQRVGARPAVVDAVRHDAAVARVSHLPLLAAAALVLAAAKGDQWRFDLTLGASGFRDTTRLASGSPLMARDICLTNAGPITTALDAYIETLQSLRTLITEKNGPGLLARFAAAREARDHWQHEHAPGQ